MNIRDLEQLASSIKDPLATLRAALTQREIERDEKGAVKAVHEEDRERVDIRVALALGLLPIEYVQFDLSPEDHAALRVREVITGEKYADTLVVLEARQRERQDLSRRLDEGLEKLETVMSPATVADGPTEENLGESGPFAMLDVVEFVEDVAGEEHAKKGERGTIVEVLGDGEAFMVEIVVPDSDPRLIDPVFPNQIKKVEAADVAENLAPSESEKDATAQTDGVDTAPLEAPAEEPKKKGRR